MVCIRTRTCTCIHSLPRTGLGITTSVHTLSAPQAIASCPPPPPAQAAPAQSQAQPPPSVATAVTAVANGTKDGSAEEPNVLPAIIGGVGGAVGVLLLGLFAFRVWCKKSAEKKAAAPPVQPSMLFQPQVQMGSSES